MFAAWQSSGFQVSVSRTMYEDYLASQQPKLAKRNFQLPVIDFIRLNNKSKLSDEVFYARLEIQEHAPSIYTEIYQPLDYKSRYFIHPRLLYNKNPMNFYTDTDEKLAEYQLTKYGIDLAFDREFGT